ncbi:MAG: M3 family metallopeptidase [Propionibacteriaceae bacterium]|jgi:peptidyl-dipeptidase Dcp|nr:M3 family metallopeptidase [Propionibacteriaceae bacterium]
MSHPFALRFGLTDAANYGMPDFAALSDEAYLEAFRDGMREQSAAMATLASQTEAATSQLLRDWEKSGRLLDRVSMAFGTLKEADTNDRRDEIEELVAPELAAHTDAIYLDRRLYDRFVALAERADAGEIQLDPQDQWLLSETLREYRRHGVELNEDDAARLRQLNERVAALHSRYSALVVAGRKAASPHVEDVAALAGLSPAQVDLARAAAESRGLSGYVLELVNTTAQPMLTALENRETRRLLFEASVGRGCSAESDVRPLILELLRLRAEKAHLLGFRDYAAYVADDGCAKTTATVMDLLTKVATAATTNVQREAAELEALLREDVPGATLEAWDWQFYAERAKAAQLQFDEAELMPYLNFETVLVKGVFAAATALYGITFTLDERVQGYTADCRVYEVREADGSLVGLVVFDPYARPTKQGGAWMTSLVEQNQLFDEKPVVTNNCNQPKPIESGPSLMTWDEVTTLFHEFGHDLHGLLSDVRYPSRSGTNTPSDFVEYPSQVNEIWAWEPSLIAQYTRHWQTGQPMPQAMVEKVASSRHIGEGYAASETYQAMMLDQLWHQTPVEDLPTEVDQIDAFEHALLVGAGVWFGPVPPRYKTCYFSHIWGGGYAAAYYSYLFSEVLDADTAAWFADNGGLNRVAGERFRRHLLAVGGSMDVMVAYREFRGADPDPIHLLRRRGLDTSSH